MDTPERRKILIQKLQESKRLLYKFTRQVADAEDLLSETTEKCFSNIHRMPLDEKDIAPWVYVIMRNSFINKYRRSKKSPIINNPMEDWTLPDTIYVESDAMPRIELQQVLKCLDELHYRYKTAMLLWLGGYTYIEIAKKMQIPLNTTKGRIYIAREYLKKKFGKQKTPPIS